jgi:hypothetical protein
MYGESFEVDEEIMGKDYMLPIGKGEIAREG